jgi:hypothetical protein
LNLSAHLAGQHERDHLEIGNERPEWILESRRAILFNDKMGEPCKRVTDNKEQREEIPSSGSDEIYKKSNSERGSDEVQ